MISNSVSISDKNTRASNVESHVFTIGLRVHVPSAALIDAEFVFTIASKHYVRKDVHQYVHMALNCLNVPMDVNYFVKKLKIKL